MTTTPFPPIRRAGRTGSTWAALVASAALVGDLPAQQPPLPATPTDTVVDVYHGTPVADPFRWLEDLAAPSTVDWIDRQNAASQPYLAALPARPHFEGRLTELLAATGPGVVRRQGRFWVTNTLRHDGSQVFLVQDAVDREPRVLLDPAELFPVGDTVVPSAHISPDGRYLAYTVADGGSDLMEIRIRDLETGRDLPDRIGRIKFDGPQWTADGRGLVYWRYTQPGDSTNDGVDRGGMVMHHRLGSPASQDHVLAVARSDEPGAGTWSILSDDGRLVIVLDGLGDLRQLSVIDLGDPLDPDWDAPRVDLNTSRDGNHTFIGSRGRTVYLRTFLDAPNGRVVAVDLDDPLAWREVLAEASDPLQFAFVIGGRLVVAYQRDVQSAVEVRDLEGRKVRDVPLPGIGTAFRFSGSPTDPLVTFTFDSFTHPPTVFTHDVRSGETRVLASPSLGIDADAFATRQVFFTSKDGTRVPMFVTHRRDIPLDGTVPTMLYGYGASFDVASPIFQDDFYAWIEAGGLLAVANVRGGGEYGAAWHEAGRMERKQNSFDDFIGAAEALIAEGYTSPSHLAIHGASNGGLLLGAVMTQRPDLFAAAVPVVGVLDALRFPSFTAGPRWATEMGDPADPEAFEWLIDWSPYHNIGEDVCHPATLVLTAANDDIVHPSQSYKFAARLQAAQRCEAPVILRVYPTGAHDILLPPHVSPAADVLAFVAHHTGLKPRVR